MAQPIRKQIIEANPSAGVKKYVTLLVDGTNLLKQSMVDTKVNTKGMHYGGVMQFLIQLRIMLARYTFEYVYVFFDDEDSGILRYELYHDYKANRDKKYGEHLSPQSDYMREYEERLKNMKSYLYAKSAADRAKRKAEKGETPDEMTQKEIDDINFARERTILMEMFNELYIRWMMDEQTEADDLIAYYVQHKRPEERIVIMSTDEDLTQLISDEVCVYNRMLKPERIISTKNFSRIKGYHRANVVVKKIITGDSSDNIGNIDGVSEKRLYELMPEIKERPVTVEEIKERARVLCEERAKAKKKPLKWQENIVNGTTRKNYDGDIYEINEKLIDLSKPLLTDGAREEISSMMYAPQDLEGRSLANLVEIIEKNDITELRDTQKFSTFFEPYKMLMDREITKFKKECLSK